jgi:hypothetical protein
VAVCSKKKATLVKSSFGGFWCPITSGHVVSCFPPVSNESSVPSFATSVAETKLTLDQSLKPVPPLTIMLPSPDSNLLGLPDRTPLADPTTNTITAAAAIVVRPKTQRLRTGRWR